MKQTIKKRFTALFLAAAMTVVCLPVKTDVTAKAECLDAVTYLGRQVAAEGCVLLKNDNEALPLEDVTVSVFGRTQCNYYKSGTGSGGDVKAPYVVDILEGLRKNPKVRLNEDLVQIYADWVKEHPYQGAGSWTEPWNQEEMPLTQEMAEEAEQKSDAAVIILGRTAGEDKDAANTKGSYQITDLEDAMLDTVSKTFDRTIVVLNVTSIMDMSWVEKYPEIDSVIYVWTGGMNGGDGVADVLTGDVNPSGHLTDTIAKSYADYPSQNFGSSSGNYYTEDIYVGYRYFETFAQDRVAYPFGYGLSYTTFEISTYSVTERDGYINVYTTVENTGERAGKETVQVYYGAPQGTLGNPVKELAAFAKTGLLQPGESCDVTLQFRIDSMAPYDDSGVSGYDSAYVMEAGDYKIYVGNNVRDSRLEYHHSEKETRVVEQLEEEMAPVYSFSRMKPEEDANGKLSISYEEVPTQTVDVIQKIADNLPEELEAKDGEHYDLIDVYKGSLTMEQFVAQLTDDELISIVQGEGMSPNHVTEGVASAFGGVNVIKDGKKVTLTDLYGIPRAAAADGPSGIRQSAAATSLPGGAAIACTWNPGLVERMFRLEGQEMVLNEIDTILGPGINLHRNPLNGRNFEYYSEDPLVTGKIAAAVTKGVQSAGATVTIKHFAANNQESSRHYVDARVSERALRQLYLKCFEISIKEGNVRSVMTSYNPINGLWAASNYDLSTDILRKEWGYDGIVMTDWWARMNQNIGDSSTTASGTDYLSCMVKSQNDLYMPVSDAATQTGKINDMKDRLESGYVTRAELQRCAVNICNYLLKSQAFARLYDLDFEPYDKPGEDWFVTNQDASADPRLTALSVDGEEIAEFDPYVLEYKVQVSGNNVPVVTAEAARGAKITIEQADGENPTALIHVSGDGEETIYRVFFTLTDPAEEENRLELLDIKVNGVSIDGFLPEKTEYTVPLDNPAEEPEITVDKSDDIQAEPVYNAAKKEAVITCSKKDSAEPDHILTKDYTIYFGAKPVSDEFEGSQLGSQWSIEAENADNWSLQDGHLKIQTEKGSLYETENNNKNQFVQQAFGDWEAVAKLDIEKMPYQLYQSFGVIVKEDDDNYLCLKVEYSNDTTNNRGTGFEVGFIKEENQKRQNITEFYDAYPKNDTENYGSNKVSHMNKIKNAESVYFRITKKGDTYYAAVSADGRTYIRMGSTVAKYNHPLFGLCVGNGGSNTAEGLFADYDYVRFTTEDPVVQIGANTTFKAAELDPIEISSKLNQEDCSDEGGGLNFGNCDQGEYAVYKINVEKTGIYNFKARMASDEDQTVQVKFTVSIDGEDAAGFVTNGTGGWQSWKTSAERPVRMTAGEHTLKIYFDKSGMNLNWIQMTLPQENILSDENLTEKVQEAEAKDISSYPLLRQQEFNQALAEAKKALQQAATQTEIDEAFAALSRAESQLAVEAPITAIVLSPASLSIHPGDTVKLTAYTTPAEGCYTDELFWSSDNEDVAEVNASGEVTAKKEGEAVITVGNGRDITVSVKVTVREQEEVKKPDTEQQESYIKDVKTEIDQNSLYYGGNVGNTAKVSVKLPKGAEIYRVDYRSSNPSAAAVSVSGRVKAVGSGNAVISAEVTLTNGESAKWAYAVTVKKAYIQGINVPTKMKKGKKITLKAQAFGSDTGIVWKLAKPSKAAKLTKAGKLKALKKGKVKIKVVSGDIQETFTIKIK